MELTYGTLCSGIESATVAVEPLGWKAVWFSEIEPFPCAVLAHHYPDVPNLGDMTHVGAQVRIGDEVAPDVLIAGTPCQAFSVAGTREGLADERGQLTLEYVKLIDDVDRMRSENDAPPTIDLWENVPGVLSSRDNAFGCFLGALSGADCELQPPGKRWPNSGCVYGPKRAIAWRVLDAQYFGVAQRRRRVFVVASARKGFHPAQVLFEREGVHRDSPPRRGEGQGVTSTLDASFGRLRGGSGQDLNHGCTHLVAFGGNNQSGPIDVATARSASASASGRLDFESETFVVHGTQDPDVAQDCAHTLGRNHGQENAVFDPNQITSVTNRSQPTPGLCHTLPASSRAPIAFSCKDYGAYAGEVAPTLRSGNYRNNSNPATEADSLVVTSAVRRLTPRECERLQGFPDDYTLVPYGRAIRPEKLDADYAKYLMRGGKMTYEQCLQAAADGPRYKAIGNSKAVPVVRWIAKRIEWALQHPWENDL